MTFLSEDIGCFPFNSRHANLTKPLTSLGYRGLSDEPGMKTGLGAYALARLEAGLALVAFTA